MYVLFFVFYGLRNKMIYWILKGYKIQILFQQELCQFYCGGQHHISFSIWYLSIDHCIVLQLLIISWNSFNPILPCISDGLVYGPGPETDRPNPNLKGPKPTKERIITLPKKSRPFTASIFLRLYRLTEFYSDFLNFLTRFTRQKHRESTSNSGMPEHVWYIII